MDKETKTCPFCCGEILTTAKKCKHCKQFIPENEKTSSESTTKKCPFCGEEILATAKKCKHCGEWLIETDDNNIVKCSFCGKPVTKDVEKCPNCGEWLKDEISELSCGFGFQNTVTTWVLYCSVFFAILIFLLVALGANGDPAFQVLVELIVWPIVAFIFSFLSLYVYLLPSIFARSKNHPQFLAILLVNIFFWRKWYRLDCLYDMGYNS